MLRSRSFALLGLAPLALFALTFSACSSDSSDVPGGGDGTEDDGGGASGEGGTTGTGDDGGASATDATPPIPEHALRGDYFDDYDKLAQTRYDAQIDFSWPKDADLPGPGMHHSNFSVRWSGTVEPRYSEEYTFTTHNDDGVRLWIDGKLIVDNWISHAAEDHAGKITLTAGKAYDLRLEYYQADQAAVSQLSWQSASQAKEIVPTSQLRPLLKAPAVDGGAPLGAPRPYYKNAVVPFDCPDPGVLKVDGTPADYYMVCTGGQFPIRHSNDLVTWSDTGQKLLPGGTAPWAVDGGRNWAPEIHKVGNQYVAYYTASGPGSRLAIGVAHAASPTGPYTHAANPIVADGTYGLIDATFFADDNGTPYLYWKVDGNAVGQHTPIYGRKLTTDGLAFAPGSTAVEVLNNDTATWEGGVVEAPWVVHRGAYYYLFYSGNVYDERYRTGVARASSPLGPYTKKGTPILGNNNDWVGPGHGSVIVAHDGHDYFFHHAWPTNGQGVRNAAAGRYGLADPIVYVAGWPQINDGTSSSGLMAWP